MRRYEEIEISLLKPYKNNARTHSEEQITQIANSIKEFGFINPVLIDGDHNVIAGHGRIMGAKKLDLKKVPCLFIEDLTEEQKRAYILADNRLAELAGWDRELLKIELEELTALDFDISIAGFDFDEWIDEPDQEYDESIDNVDIEIPEEPSAKLGDIYQLGNHRLMCGDATNRQQVLDLIGGVNPDIVYTDPPYGMYLDTDYSAMKDILDFTKDKGVKQGNKYKKVIGDHDDFTPALITTVFENFAKCKETFLFGADYYSEHLQGKNEGSWIVWDKRLDDSADKMYGSCFELVWSKKRHKRDIARIKWAGLFGTEQEFDKKRHHPTQKPVRLSEWFIQRFSEVGANVVDIYGGSGSTLIACEKIDRNCFMMEIDPHYIDVIIARWEKYTGQKAVKIEV